MLFDKIGQTTVGYSAAQKQQVIIESSSSQYYLMVKRHVDYHFI
jgi:hypothetical protein